MNNQNSTGIGRLEYQPLPKSTNTHQALIHRIKTTTNLPNLQSSFISRKNLLNYISLIYNQNRQIAQALNPPSLHNEIQKYQIQCTRLREILTLKQKEENILRSTLAKLQEELVFTKEYSLRNSAQCQAIEKQIQVIMEENSISVQSEIEPVSLLMEKFIGYFEDPEGQLNGKYESKKKDVKEQKKRKGVELPKSLQKSESQYEGEMKIQSESGINKLEDQLAEVLHHPHLQIVNYTYTGYEGLDQEQGSDIN